jgi:hypothetical protein
MKTGAKTPSTPSPVNKVGGQPVGDRMGMSDTQDLTCRDEFGLCDHAEER